MQCSLLGLSSMESEGSEALFRYCKLSIIGFYGLDMHENCNFLFYSTILFSGFYFYPLLRKVSIAGGKGM